MGLGELFIFSIWFGIAGIGLLALMPTKWLRWALPAIALASFGLTTYWAAMALGGRSARACLGSLQILGSIDMSSNSLSAWFVIIANIAMLWAVYHASLASKSHTVPSTSKLHYLALATLHQSLIWVLTAQNGFVFLFAWEIMSLSSALLLLNGPLNPKTLQPMVSYLVQMHISGICLAMAIVWMYVSTGQLTFEALPAFLNSEAGIWPFFLFFVGFGLKAEFVPLHGKIPHAYRTASPHVAALLSGVMVKMGIFGLIKAALAQSDNLVLLGETVLTVSLLSALYGAMNTAVHRNIFRMLAYCTIENVGLIGAGIGLGMIGTGLQMPWLTTLGYGGALMHALNHSLGKMLLFYSGGWATLQTRTYDMDQMGGLVKPMPQTASLFLVGALALCGLPPFNGFVSEFMLYGGLIHGLGADKLEVSSLMVLGLGVMAFVGGMAIHAFTKTFGVMFLGQWRSKHPMPQYDAPYSNLIPQYLLVALMLTVALWPAFYVGTVYRVLADVGIAVLPAVDVQASPLLSSVGRINLYVLAFLAVAALVWAARQRLASKKAPVSQPTWGCANQFSGAKLQYTGKSFTKPLGKIFGFVIVEQKCYHEIGQGNVFPHSRKYASHYHDFVEHKLLDQLLQRLVQATNLFKFIQNGRVQSYVLYGIVFILAIFVLTLFTILP